MLAQPDLIAIVAALVVDRAVIAPETDRVRAERAAIRRARRLVALAYGVRARDLAGTVAGDDE
jgi:hypothetical protein